jgi:hypothetical protein
VSVIGLFLGLDRRDRGLRHIFSLLHGARDVAHGCDRGGADVFPAVPLTAIAGWLIYSERLDMFTIFGAVLILTGNLLNLKMAVPRAARAGAGSPN